MGRTLEIGRVYRFAKQARPEIAVIDAHANWFFATAMPLPGFATLSFQTGIFRPRQTQLRGRSATSVVLCNSSPHRAGSDDVPWSDVIRSDDGYALYYGDSKTGDVIPTLERKGNAILLNAWSSHQDGDRDVRLLAPPVILLTSQAAEGEGKGFRRVQGLCLVSRADFVIQRDPRTGVSFRNIRFELMVLDLQEENDAIPMDWINYRRTANFDPEVAYRAAPRSWKYFIDRGIGSMERFRRKVLHQLLVPDADQLVSPSSALGKILQEVATYFRDRPADFEAVGAHVAETVFKTQGIDYRTAWLTPAQGDGGFDFVGTLDFNRVANFISSRQVMIGQVKCENPSRATGGDAVARLAARLRKGWCGTYVTTSRFSRPLQKEVLDDHLPITLINGRQVAEVLLTEVEATNMRLPLLLDTIVQKYAGYRRALDPALAVLER